MAAVKQFIFIGPPGSGKGTQAKLLAETLGVPHISTGDLFRAAIGAHTELGNKAEALLAAGSLVPDEITNQVVAERLRQSDAGSGFVLDGYPRNTVQVKFLESLYPAVSAVLIELPDDTAVARIAGRRTCAACGAIYHLEYKRPQVAGVCDTCGSRLVQRNDETESVVRGRLVSYHKETEPVVAYYREHGQLIVVDGRPAIPEVTQQIRQRLGLV